MCTREMPLFPLRPDGSTPVTSACDALLDLLAAQQEKVRDLCLLVIEVGENADPVVETLAESFSARQPKVVANAASLVAACLAAFGAKIVNPKLFLKVIYMTACVRKSAATTSTLTLS